MMRFADTVRARRKPSLTPMIDVVFLLLVFLYDIYLGSYDFSGLNRINYEILGAPFMGMALCFIGWRLGHYFREPRVRLTRDSLYYSGFWRVRQWKLDDIQHVSTKIEKLRKHRALPHPLLIEWVVLELKNGRSPRFIAPRSHLLNGDLYASLSERLQMPIERDDRDVKDVPRGVSPFGLFNIKHFIERF